MNTVKIHLIFGGQKKHHLSSKNIGEKCNDVHTYYNFKLIIDIIIANTISNIWLNIPVYTGTDV